MSNDNGHAGFLHPAHSTAFLFRIPTHTRQTYRAAIAGHPDRTVTPLCLYPLLDCPDLD